MRQGSPVYTPGQVMPIVTTAPQEFPGRAVLNVERCDNTKPAHMPCIGLVENGIDPGKVGRVITQGILTTGLGSWPVGTKLYVGVNGGLTDVKPVAPNVVQQVAIVLGQAATSCMILVDVKAPEVVISAATALPVASPFASPFIVDNGATVIQEVRAIGSAALQVFGTQVANFGTAANFTGYNNYFGKYVKFTSAASFNTMAGCYYVNGQIQPVLVHTKAAASFALASTTDYTLDTRIFVGLCAGVPLTGPDGFRVLAGITYDSAQDSGWMVWLQYTDVETTNMLWKVRVPFLDQNGVQIPVKANTHYDLLLDFHGEKPAGQRSFDLKLTSYEVAGSTPNFTFTTRVGTHHEANFQTTPVYNGFYQLTGMQAITLTTAAVSKEMMIRRLITAYDADFSSNT